MHHFHNSPQLWPTFYIIFWSYGREIVSKPVPASLRIGRQNITFTYLRVQNNNIVCLCNLIIPTVSNILLLNSFIILLTSVKCDMNFTFRRLFLAICWDIYKAFRIKWVIAIIFRLIELFQIILVKLLSLFQLSSIQMIHNLVSKIIITVIYIRWSFKVACISIIFSYHAVLSLDWVLCFNVSIEMAVKLFGFLPNSRVYNWVFGTCEDEYLRVL